METNYKHIHRKVMHLLRKKKKSLEQKVSGCRIIIIFFFLNHFSLYETPLEEPETTQISQAI